MREIKSISSEDFKVHEYDDIIDVRSPNEFNEDHLPNALNLPVLDNSEREEIGTIYKNENPFIAKRKGAALVSFNISNHLKTYFSDKEKDYSPLVYCWRGGERSRSLSIILNSIGWKPTILKGGYQGYRKYIIKSLEEILSTSLNLKIISGLTGSGKTKLLKHLFTNGAQIIDLEGLANHKGSALGGDEKLPQPSQKKFERNIFKLIESFDPKMPIFLESESSRIGDLQVPAKLWSLMKNSSLIEVEIPHDKRIELLTNEYQHLIDDKNLLLTKLEKIKHLKSSSVFENWVNLINEGNITNFVDSILKDHYDQAYLNSRKKTYLNDPENSYFLKDISDKSYGDLAQRIISNT